MSHMAALAQLVELLVVVQAVAGSSPAGRPIYQSGRESVRFGILAAYG